MNEFDLQWLADAAKTNHQKAQLCILLAMAGVGESMGRADGFIGRVLVYKNLVCELERQVKGGKRGKQN